MTGSTGLWSISVDEASGTVKSDSAVVVFRAHYGRHVIDDLSRRFRTLVSDRPATDDEAIRRFAADLPYDVAWIYVADRLDVPLLLSSKSGFPTLYYARTPTAILVSDTVGCVGRALDSEGLGLTLDPQYLADYLVRVPSWYGSQAPPTPFTQIKTLPQASITKLSSNNAEVRRYLDWWPDRQGLTGRRAREAVMAAINSAVDFQRDGENAPALTLSGGIDTTMLAVAAMRTFGPRVHGYLQTGMQTCAVDEVYYANAVAEHCRITPHYFAVDDYWSFREVPDHSRAPQWTPDQGGFYAKWRALAQEVAQSGHTALLWGGLAEASFCPALGGQYLGLFNPLYNLEASREADLWLRSDIRRGRTPELIRQPLALRTDLVPPVVVPAWAEVAGVQERAQDLVDFLNSTDLDPVNRDRLATWIVVMAPGNAMRSWSSDYVTSDVPVRFDQTFAQPVVWETVQRVESRELLAPLLDKPFQRRALKRMIPERVRLRKVPREFGYLIVKGLRERESNRLAKLGEDSRLEAFGAIDGDRFRAGLAQLTAPAGTSTGDEVDLELFLRILWAEVWLRDFEERGFRAGVPRVSEVHPL